MNNVNVGPLDADVYYMQQALACANEAEKLGEVPVGAVLVINEQVISRGSNQTITECDPTAHAEILVLQQSAKVCNNHRLLGATLYVTLEPCIMCVGAMIQARIKRLVFGAYDSRFGAIASRHSVLQTKGLNHVFDLTDGVLADSCAEKLRNFFLQKRRHPLKN